MKILSLLFLLISAHAMAYDWQYSVQSPDGKIETRNINDSEGFFFDVGDLLCSVSEPEDFDQAQEYYEIRCTSPEGGLQGIAARPRKDQEYSKWALTNGGGKKAFKVEVIAFHDTSKKNRKPFSN